MDDFTFDLLFRERMMLALENYKKGLSWTDPLFPSTPPDRIIKRKKTGRVEVASEIPTIYLTENLYAMTGAPSTFFVASKTSIPIDNSSFVLSHPTAKITFLKRAEEFEWLYQMVDIVNELSFDDPIPAPLLYNPLFWLLYGRAPGSRYCPSSITMYNIKPSFVDSVILLIANEQKKSVSAVSEKTKRNLESNFYRNVVNTGISSINYGEEYWERYCKSTENPWKFLQSRGALKSLARVASYSADEWMDLFSEILENFHKKINRTIFSCDSTVEMIMISGFSPPMSLHQERVSVLKRKFEEMEAPML